MASNAAAKNETDHLKTEIESLRDMVDHLQTTMEDQEKRFFPETIFSPELDVVHQLEVAFTKLDHISKPQGLCAHVGPHDSMWIHEGASPHGST